jgi:hypothetical protein
MSRMGGRQASAHKMIARWGGVGKLVNATDSTQFRTATMARMDYTPKEREKLAVDAETRLRISAVGLVTPPDMDNEYIVYAGKTFKILMPPAGPSSDGAAFAFWDVPVVGTELG